MWNFIYYMRHLGYLLAPMTTYFVFTFTMNIDKTANTKQFYFLPRTASSISLMVIFLLLYIPLLKSIRVWLIAFVMAVIHFVAGYIIWFVIGVTLLLVSLFGLLFDPDTVNQEKTIIIILAVLAIFEYAYFRNIIGDE